ncbi:phosphoadenosine phosphosulfate reductase family protein [Paracoccus limosus]|uniref:Phosphoadenosine phosphosulfate reductase family protein n=1 Tax=Paracoccus limosus TaxID=913252 RepID=A0A844H3T7_9RHOB|nr:phosphoadenosine phosphosulfate reductase family protein [Paracoccus limosus]MTH33028.1 phosphoadenosine phosphosulfate reductase family protein [Paracoccus limosus]
MIQHIVNISGGKDSTACYLLALQRGVPFRAVMADTGNEHPITIEYAERLCDRTGGPQVEIYRADFTERMDKKRAYIAEHWAAEGVPQAWVDRAIAALQPTGIPFLDLYLWKGRFPSRRVQFCTEFLKSEPIGKQVIDPARQAGPVAQWLGVRRAESLARRNAPMWQTVRTPGQHAMRFYRPLIHWSAENVFGYAAAHGLDPNPLYLQGMGRVGCFPCINANKGEIRAIAIRFPEAFERISEWEAICAEASKRQRATFFAADVTPEGAAHARRISKINDREERDAASAQVAWPTARDVAEWARTDRGGRQFNLLEAAFAEDEALSCSSQYGLCE